MIFPRNVDLDRLHAAVELITSDRYRHHREGKTAAYVSLMVGEVELGGQHNNYLYIGSDGFFTSRVLREFKRVVLEMVPEARITSWTHDKIVVNETQQFFFRSVHDLIKNPSLVSGWSLDRIFVDIDTVTQQRLDKNGHLSEMFQALLPRIVERRGDVV